MHAQPTAVKAKTTSTSQRHVLFRFTLHVSPQHLVIFKSSAETFDGGRPKLPPKFHTAASELNPSQDLTVHRYDTLEETT